MPLCVLRDADEITTSMWLDAIMGFATVHCHTHSFFFIMIFFPRNLVRAVGVDYYYIFFSSQCSCFLSILLLVDLLLHF